jgi:hypothetical protein
MIVSSLCFDDSNIIRFDNLVNYKEFIVSKEVKAYKFVTPQGSHIF